MNHGDLMNADRIIKCEEKISQKINLLTHYDHSTLLDKSGKLIKIIKLSGLDYISKDKQALDTYKNRRNNLLKSFSSEFAMYWWDVLRKVNHYTNGEFTNDYAYSVNEKYKAQIEKNDMFHKELYLAIVTKHPEGLINKSYSFLQQLTRKFDREAKKIYLAKRHKELEAVARKVLGTLSDYDCKLLGVYEKNGVLLSESLAFISELINFSSFSVPLQTQDVSCILPRKRLFFNRKSGTIEMRAADGSQKFSAMLSIKGYAPITYQGILDKLNSLRCEYTITQSYRFYDKQVAKAKLRDQQNEMLQSKEESITQTEEIDEAFDDAASGEVGFGKHHFTVACYADTQEELNHNISMMVSSFSDVDVTSVREDVACEMAFWSQLPGNFSYAARCADISTRNMAAFASMHNVPRGKLTGNHWGDAVTVFETITGSPYYFNFHYKDVGNFLVFGAMGSGKTVLVGFLILQSMKFGGKRIIFDKDRGFEIAVRMMGGIYERIKPGIRTGFNPCHLADSIENRKFLSLLLAKMLTANGGKLNEADHVVIIKAIEGMYRLAFSSRQLCHIASFFGVKKPGSLRARFDEWHSDGAHAWVFDNETDHLNLDPDVLGFDLSHLLADLHAKTPALMYLTYRIEKALEGQRGILFIDEAWIALEDEYFRTLINDWSRTPRKKNNIFGLATQVANDTVNLHISKAINESAFCKIFFPNPSANQSVYMDEFGLSYHEYQLIKTLADDQHYFLLKHGRGIYAESVVLRANLTGLEDEIAILSAREETLILLDQIRAEVGDDPKLFWPIFHTRRKGKI